MILRYYDSVCGVLTQIRDTQTEKLRKAGEWIGETICRDGIVYIFGCGHSHLIGLDCFYRAGGLANVSAMLDTDLMLHNGAAKSSVMEKMPGIAHSILDRYCIGKSDILIIISTSGKNAVPVEMAQEAQRRGIKTISIVSSLYFEDKKDSPLLYECTDLYIDNCVPHGDAAISIPGVEMPMGSVSTAASSFILQSAILEGAQFAASQGAEVPVYCSGNVTGGAQYNRVLIQKYLPRIKHL